MNVLVIGAGGREHALVKNLSRDGSKVYCIPGNGGIAQDAVVSILTLFPPYTELLDFIRTNKIDFVIVGPEKLLVEGIVDVLQQQSIPVLGPTRAGSQIEGSKIFAKKLMHKYDIPTAKFACFTDYESARDYIWQKSFPLVIKADGLAAGKGVIICSNKEQANQVLEDMLVRNIFTMLHPRVVIEEFLDGKELSVIALTDGASVVLFPPSRDHKRAGDNDSGPNTGGMGAFSCNEMLDKTLEKSILDDIISPTIEGLKNEGIVYKGILYAGLMLTKKGPYVVEFNCRFGDPETQAILPRLSEGLLPLLLQAYEGTLVSRRVKTVPDPSLCVILTSGGYPGPYETGYPIYGLESIQDTDVSIFHSGTAYKEGTFYTAGGRILGINAVKKSLEECRNTAYTALRSISFKNMHFRSDIGKG